MQRRVLVARMSALAERRQVRVTVSTETKGRDGLVVETRGIDLRNFKANPVILWEHNSEAPVARAIDISVRGSDLVALAQFPTEGTSPKADEVYSLVAQGIVSAASIGFDPLETEPLPDGGLRITQCDLAEFSFVSIPALPDALVTERSRRMEDHMMHRLSPEHRRRAEQYRMELAVEAAVRRALAERSSRASVPRHSLAWHRRNAARMGLLVGRR